MMMLSAEQTRAVNAGIRETLTWQLVERPAGPQEIPDWCKGARVDWMDGYSNSPSVKLKVTHDVRDWEDQRFEKEGNFYRARHADGRLEQYGHNGPISLAEVQMFRSADGTLRQYRREGPEWYVPPEDGSCWPQHGWEPGEFVKVVMPATSPQQGFGGAHIHLDMLDGSKLVLRGPWHCAPPPGYVEVSYCYPPERPYRQRKKGTKPWSGLSAMAGLYITTDLLVRIMSRFQPHLELAEVDHRGVCAVEPMKPEWDAPKAVIMARQRAERERAKAGAA